MDSAEINPLLIVLFAVAGACLGSFSTALSYRLSHGQSWFLTRKDHALSPSRSACPSCRHALAFPDLVPILSWCLTRGQCRYCREKIALSYPLTELSAMFLTAGLVLVYGMQWPLLPMVLSVPFLLSVLCTNACSGQTYMTLSWAAFLCGALFFAFKFEAGGHIAAALVLPIIFAVAGMVSFGWPAVRAGIKTDGLFLAGAGLFTGLSGLPLFLLAAAPLIVFGAVFCGITKRKSLDFLPSIYAVTLIIHFFLTGIGFDGRAVLLTAG